MDATAEAGIAKALDRIDDFLSVQGDCPSREAVDLLQASVGINEDTRAVLAQRIDAFGEHCHRGQVLFGVIVGLLAAQLQEASSSGPCQESGFRTD